jgi:hypothetical protein
VKKNLSCVTTRRRKLWVLNSLRRGLHSLTARFLVLGVLGFDVGFLATFTLPPRCVPAADFPQAFRILTVALVVTPRLVLAPAPFAQASPQVRAAPSGLGTPLSFTLTGAHGRFDLPREKLGEDVFASSSGVIKTWTRRLLANLSACGEQNKNANKTLARRSSDLRRTRRRMKQR